MFGQLKTYDIPRLRSFLNAKLWYDRVVPIRGSSVRPIGDRKSQHKRIVQVSKDGQQGYACRLYSTDCVTFLEDGRIHINHDNYTTNSTKDFINAVLGYNTASVSSVKGEFVVKVATGTFLIPGDGLYLDADLRPINPEPCVIHKINRKAANAIRAKHADFIAYAVGIANLCEGKFEVPQLTYFHPHNVVEGMESDDINDWWRAAQQLVDRYGKRVYIQGEAKRLLFPHEMKNAIEKVFLAAYTQEILTAVTLPLGEYKPDRFSSVI